VVPEAIKEKKGKTHENQDEKREKQAQLAKWGQGLPTNPQSGSRVGSEKKGVREGKEAPHRPGNEKVLNPKVLRKG